MSDTRIVFTKEMVEELFRLSPELEMAVIEAAEVLSAAFAEYEAERRQHGGAHRLHRLCAGRCDGGAAMTPVTQTKFGSEGNCFAAVLASLFAVPLADVEHIVGDVGDGWLDRLAAWLAARGLTFAFIPAAFYRLPDTLYIACGFTARGHYHAVIKRGSALVFDPHPDHQGLDETTELLFILPRESENAP